MAWQPVCNDDGVIAEPSTSSLEGFTCAGSIDHRGLNLGPANPPPGRSRHHYGNGPFAKLVMPKLPTEPGLYAWQLDDIVVYLGQTRTPLAKRLGPNGYATITTYNTLARQPGKTNGGQQTNCRVNTLANAALAVGSHLVIWFLVTPPEQALTAEAVWMARHGKPEWNRRLERSQP